MRECLVENIPVIPTRAHFERPVGLIIRERMSHERKEHFPLDRMIIQIFHARVLAAVRIGSQCALRMLPMPELGLCKTRSQESLSYPHASGFWNM